MPPLTVRRTGTAFLQTHYFCTPNNLEGTAMATEQTSQQILKTTSQQHSKQEPKDVWLAKRLVSLQALSPGQALSPEANDLYLSEMSLILAEIGPQSFDTAIHKLIRTSKFMPTIEAIR